MNILSSIYSMGSNVIESTSNYISSQNILGRLVSWGKEGDRIESALILGIAAAAYLYYSSKSTSGRSLKGKFERAVGSEFKTAKGSASLPKSNGNPDGAKNLGAEVRSDGNKTKTTPKIEASSYSDIDWVSVASEGKQYDSGDIKKKLYKEEFESKSICGEEVNAASDLEEYESEGKKTKTPTKIEPSSDNQTDGVELPSGVKIIEDDSGNISEIVWEGKNTTVENESDHLAAPDFEEVGLVAASEFKKGVDLEENKTDLKATSDFEKEADLEENESDLKAVSDVEN